MLCRIIPISVLAAVLVTAAPARAEDMIACSGLFGRNASHAELIKAFGAENVVYKRIDRPQGSTGMATFLFEKNPARTLVVEWRDEAAKARPIYIGISNPSKWIGPLGIRIGTGIEEIEKLNGKVFRLNGFGWDLGGNTQFDKKDGKLGDLPGGCQYGFTFEPTAEGLPLGGKYRVLNGNHDLFSNMKLLREIKPALVEILIIYPENH
jgi:hypothetical protein